MKHSNQSEDEWNHENILMAQYFKFVPYFRIASHSGDGILSFV